MATLTHPLPTRKRSTRPKPPRNIRIVTPPVDDEPALVRIAEGKEVDHYFVTPMASDFGTAFHVEKLGEPASNYAVCLADFDSTCECKGFLRWGHCRHITGLTALATAKKL